MSVHPLDGGGSLCVNGKAAFGGPDGSARSVPFPVDRWNRVVLPVRPVLIRRGGRALLVDAGLGGHAFPGAEAGAAGADLLRGTGAAPGDLEGILFTHLHGDHLGGAYRRDREGRLVDAFEGAPRAAARREWEEGRKSAGERGSGYDAGLLEALGRDPAVRWTEGEETPFPGARLIDAPGHTAGHRAALVEGEEGAVLLPGDLIPARPHLRLRCVSAEDREPERTVETKRVLLERAEREGWLVVLPHEPERPPGTVRRTGEETWELDPAGTEEGAE